MMNSEPQRNLRYHTFMKIRLNHSLLLTVCVLSLTTLRCTTTPTEEPEAETAPPPAPPAVHATENLRITYDQRNRRLGDVAREISDQFGGGLVVMHGLERRMVEKADFAHATMDEVARSLADQVEGAMQSTPNYYFIYEPGYEVLNEVSLAGDLHPQFNTVTAQIQFGAGTDLYNAFKLLSEGLGVTVVADNAIASAKCGQLAVGDIPLQEGLEAILKSARIADWQIAVDSTPNYIFLYRQGRPLPQETLLRADLNNPRLREYLESDVTLSLPRPPESPDAISIQLGAAPLERMLPELSAQLGAPVVAEDELLRLPVNPVSMRGVTVRTALDLFIKQWLVDDIGYQLTEDRIVFRRRQPGE